MNINQRPDIAYWFRGLIVLLALAVAACGGTRHPPAPDTVDFDFQRDYLVGPGDTVSIIVWGNPEVSMSIPVRPDGKITTPLVEDLPATNKTPTQLARDIEDELGHYLRDPVVTVVVTGFAGPYNRQVRVIGQAAQPQALQYREEMSLMDVMIAVGGITEFAAGNRATILRQEPGGRKQYNVRIDDLVNGGDITANVDMKPGDVLIIPESFF